MWPPTWSLPQLPINAGGIDLSMFLLRRPPRHMTRAFYLVVHGSVSLSRPWVLTSKGDIQFIFVLWSKYLLKEGTDSLDVYVIGSTVSWGTPQSRTMPRTRNCLLLRHVHTCMRVHTHIIHTPTQHTHAQWSLKELANKFTDTATWIPMPIII